MHLFIANATRQNFHFVYRVPESNKLREQTIPIGGQVRIAGDLNQHEIEAIIGQHRKYGLVPVQEVDRTKAFVGLCYSIDKLISVDKLGRAMSHNNDVLVARGKEIRQHAAVASNNALEASLAETQLPEQLRSMDMEIIEENHDDRDETKPVAEGIRVSREGEAPTRRRRKS